MKQEEEELAKASKTKLYVRPRRKILKKEARERERGRESTRTRVA